jgi:hypothetical protein
VFGPAEQGRVAAVARVIAGSELSVVGAVGNTTLTVYDVSSFDEGGGRLKVGAQVLGYTAVTETEDEYGDGDGSGTLSLDAPLAVEYGMDTPVLVEPRTETWEASVVAGHGDPLVCTAGSELADRLGEGTRDAAEGETVLVAERLDSDGGTGDWHVVRMLGSPVEVSGKVRESEIEDSTITASLFRTAEDGERWEVGSDPRNELKAYTGKPEEVFHGVIQVTHGPAAGSGEQGVLLLTPPTMRAADDSRVYMASSESGTAGTAYVLVSFDQVWLGISGGKVGVLGATPVVRQSVTGSRGGNAALASLLTAFANFGWITDNTTA